MDTLYNPVTGQQLIFLQTAKTTNGRLLEMESHYRAKTQEPALETEAFFRTIYGLARDGKINAKGLLGLLLAALLATQYSDEFRLARPPFWV